MAIYRHALPAGNPVLEAFRTASAAGCAGTELPLLSRQAKKHCNCCSAAHDDRYSDADYKTSAWHRQGFLQHS